MTSPRLNPAPDRISFPMLHSPKFLALLSVLFFSPAALTPAAAEPAKMNNPKLAFSHDQVARDAARYEAYLKKSWKVSDGDGDAKALMVSGQRAMAQDPRAASRHFAGATVRDAKSTDAWVGLAQSLLAIPHKTLTGSERYDIPVNASGAAYIGYMRAGAEAPRASALAVLSQALQRRGFWRPALDALKLSVALDATPASLRNYKTLRETHGFRMLDYKTDAEATPPRLCIEFSEPLRASDPDLASYVSIDGRDASDVRAEGQHLCLEGLTHGQRYEIKLRPGLKAEIDEALTKPIELAVYLPDRKPAVRATGRNYVLPSRGQQGIPLVSVNTKQIDVSVYRIGDRALSQTLQNGDLQRQLSSWDIDSLKNDKGAHVYSGALDVTPDLNKDVTTAFPVSEAIGALQPGVYVLTAKATEQSGENQNQLATQWFIVSDLGLTAFSGRDGVHAFVRSLSQTAPIAEATVRLVARNNEVLATAQTDVSGHVTFDGALARGEGGLQPAILVAQSDTGGYAFLDLTTDAFDLSDRGVKGRAAPGAVDGLLFAERGVYRPGETVHMTTLLRDANGLAANLPATLIVRRPDGVEHHRGVVSDAKNGGASVSIALTSAAMTGTWRAAVYADPKADALADVAFLVEDFVPERLNLKLKPEASTFAVGETVTIEAAGTFLYGPPAGGMGIDGEIIVKPNPAGLVGFEGYHFGVAGAHTTPVREAIAGLPATGADGRAKLTVALPKIPKTQLPLNADILVRLRESGGRTIERRVTLPVATKLPRIGIKPLFNAHAVGEGELAAFDIVHLADGTTPSTANGLSWTLQRLDTRWQWYSRNGSWAYEAVTIPRKVASGSIANDGTSPAKLSTPVEYGRYQLTVSKPTAASGSSAPPLTSTYMFNAGWYNAGDAAESPEMLDVALDKPSYKVGDTAKVRVVTKRGGRALITVLGDRLIATKDVTLPDGGGDISLDVGADWGTGAYITATLYRPMDMAQKRMPTRAIGITWAGLDTTDRTLSVAINTKAKVKSTEGLRVPLVVTGLEPGQSANVIVAAVDLGILNLTGHKTPDPVTHFYGQRRLGHEIRDLYGKLIDGMRANRGRLRSGGDGGQAMQTNGRARSATSVAFFSGVVDVGTDGTAEVDFALPNFNGTVRITAVAWTANKLGQAQTDVIVRDAVALTASLPRFLTLGDTTTLALDLHNVEGPGGAYRLAIDAQAELAGTSTILDRALQLNTDQRRTETVTLKAETLGTTTYAMKLTGPDGIDIARQVSLEIVPPARDIKRTTISTLAPGGSMTLSDDLGTGMLANRTIVNVSVGAYANLDIPSMLTELDRYPYGCAEQTISKAMPLVYANGLAAAIGQTADAKLTDRINGAIRHVFSMQDSSGAFGTWGPANTNIWLTSYVADFLTRAREQGFAVPERGFEQTLDRLRNFAAYAQEFRNGGEELSYALYVLARNGRAPMGELRYYVDTRIDRFATPLAQAQIGAALAMMGEKERASAAFAKAIAKFGADDTSAIRSDYGSRLRDGAALVALTAEANIAQDAHAGLVDVIVAARAARTYTSTQEQAWILLAANALQQQVAAQTFEVDGTAHQGAVAKSLALKALSGGGMTIANTSDSAVDAVISVIGSAATPEPAVSNGFQITRQYFTLDGKEVDLSNGAEVAQNQRLVTVVTANRDAIGGRVLLVDRLPAGFEIENPRLVAGGELKALPWLKAETYPEHTEFRDDRFVAAYDFTNEAQTAQPKPMQVAYIVRAITPGTYIHPAATVEDMYRPDRHARGDTRRLSVTASSVALTATPEGR